MRALADVARQRDVESISLSVHRANPAVVLYRAEGNRVIKSREHADAMLLDLSSLDRSTNQMPTTQ